MKKNKSIYIIFVIVIMLGISIGYAALNSTLNITGKSSISKNTWDIYFDNVVVKNGSVEAVKLPTIENNTTVDFEVALNLPGDYYEFTVDVINDGTIDAMIENIKKTPELSLEQQKYFNYIIEYQNGEQTITKQLVKKDSFVRLKVRVELKKDIEASDLPEVGDVLNLSFTVNYQQANENGVIVFNDGVSNLISIDGSIEDIGTIVTIGSEQFYTIGIEENYVKLLSMYNLYVGGEYNDGWIAYGEEATGMQDENMIGYISSDTSRKGTTSFSNDSKKGNDYSDYSGSIVEEYVNNYKTKIEQFGIVVNEATLISKEELVNNGCSLESNTCSNSYDWIYSTSYWTKSAYNDKYVWFVTSKGYFGHTNNAKDNSGVGVRPVIVISKDYF